eukprot:6481604-Amphidinium_carterae.1
MPLQINLVRPILSGMPVREGRKTTTEFKTKSMEEQTELGVRLEPLNTWSLSPDSTSAKSKPSPLSEQGVSMQGPTCVLKGIPVHTKLPAPSGNPVGMVLREMRRLAVRCCYSQLLANPPLHPEHSRSRLSNNTEARVPRSHAMNVTHMAEQSYAHSKRPGTSIREALRASSDSICFPLLPESIFDTHLRYSHRNQGASYKPVRYACILSTLPGKVPFGTFTYTRRLFGATTLHID